MIKTKEGWAILENDSHIGMWVAQEKRLDFDQNMLPAILPYIDKGDTVIDIGANIGAYSYGFLKKICESGNLICFEPYIKSFECLQYNLGGNDNVLMFNMAIGSETGGCTVNCDNDNIGMSYIVKGGNTIMDTLDSFELDACDFIKIDVEGFELDVLKGAKKTIKKYKPYLCIEINDATLNRNNITREMIFSYLNELGYKYRNIYKGQDMLDSQLDIICY